MKKGAVIIGGTSGIGLETALYLKKCGYKVLIGGRSESKDKINFSYKHIDVTSISSIKNFFSSVPLNYLGSVIYSAGISSNTKNIQKFNVNEYRKVHDVNILGAILTLKYSYPLLKKTKGKVVIISSLASRTYSKLSSFEYTVTKAGLSGLVKQLAIEWAKDGILINTIFPGMVKTSMLSKSVKPNSLKRIESLIPLGRVARPMEIATAIEFLISEKNTYITGSGVDINGGQFLSG